MKAKEVLELLKISRPTLTKYVKTGIIKITIKDNGQYDYDDKSVYLKFNKGLDRKTFIYSRVSSEDQMIDLENQSKELIQFCLANGYTISKEFKDVASGLSFNDRDGFLSMLDDILSNKVETVVVTCKDRISRTDFKLMSCLFKRHNCNIISINDEGSKDLDCKEMFNEMISFMDLFTLKLYLKDNGKDS